MSIFTQIIILLVVLATMVMVLLGIRQLTKFEGFENADETSHLKKELDEDESVLSENSIFHNLVDIDKKDKNMKREKVYQKSNSNDPLSRKE